MLQSMWKRLIKQGTPYLFYRITKHQTKLILVFPEARSSKYVLTSPQVHHSVSTNIQEKRSHMLPSLLEYEIEGKPSVTLKAGEVLFIPAGTIHAAKNVGSTDASELATYIVEKGKQLVVIVK